MPGSGKTSRPMWNNCQDFIQKTQVCFDNRFAQLLEFLSVQNTALCRTMEQNFGKLETILCQFKEDMMWLSEEISKNKRDLTDLRQISSDTTSRLDYLESEMERFESYTRRSNLKFIGIYEEEIEDGKASIETVIDTLNYFSTARKWRPSDIDHAHRIGKPRRSSSRPLIASFRHLDDKLAILRDRDLRDNLRKNGIKVSADLTPRQQAQLQHHRQQGKVAFFINGKLHVEEDNLNENRASRDRYQQPLIPRNHQYGSTNRTTHNNRYSDQNVSEDVSFSPFHTRTDFYQDLPRDNYAQNDADRLQTQQQTQRHRQQQQQTRQQQQQQQYQQHQHHYHHQQRERGVSYEHGFQQWSSDQTTTVNTAGHGHDNENRGDLIRQIGDGNQDRSIFHLPENNVDLVSIFNATVGRFQPLRPEIPITTDSLTLPNDEPVQIPSAAASNKPNSPSKMNITLSSSDETTPQSSPAFTPPSDHPMFTTLPPTENADPPTPPGDEQHMSRTPNVEILSATPTNHSPSGYHGPAEDTENRSCVNMLDRCVEKNIMDVPPHHASGNQTEGKTPTDGHTHHNQHKPTAHHEIDPRDYAEVVKSPPCQNAEVNKQKGIPRNTTTHSQRNAGGVTPRATRDSRPKQKSVNSPQQIHNKDEGRKTRSKSQSTLPATWKIGTSSNSK